MDSLKTMQKWAEANYCLGLELLRIYLGLGLFIKGIHFVVNSDFLMVTLVEAGHLDFANTLITHFVGLAHIGGGALLTFGLATRVGAFIQIPILSGALIFVGIPQGLFSQSQSFEFSALVLILLIVFTVFGGGAWSMDKRILQKSE
jgi:putative oxidoreductase